MWLSGYGEKTVAVLIVFLSFSACSLFQEESMNRRRLSTLQKMLRYVPLNRFGLPSDHSIY